MTRTARFLAAAAAALASLSCAGRAKNDPDAPVVLICIDTLRADHLPSYGYRGIETPALDALRRDSVLFENAYSAVPLTFPSHTTILTGLLPFHHGVRDNIGYRLASSRPTLATILHAHGHATGAAVSTYLLRGDRGLSAGFDFYDDVFGNESTDERPGTQTVARLEEWLGRATGRPFFAFLHLYEPHFPYEPPEPYESRYAAHPYDGEIAAADAAVGKFLDFLRERKLYDSSIIVFLSDHGEGLNEHGEEEHGIFLYREDIRVPLFVKLPGSRMKGSKISNPVGLIDIAPTVVSLLGLPPIPSADGIALFDRKQPAPGRRLYSETLYPRFHFGWSDLASLVDSRYEYIEAPRPELYDLAADPEEKKDLSQGKPPAFRAMRIELERMDRPLQNPGASSNEEVARLASLGYISPRTASSGPAVLPDPKDHIETLRRFKKLFAFYYAKKDTEAVALAREILKDDPRNLSVWRMLSGSLERMGKRLEAIRALHGGIAAAGESGVGEEIAQAYETLAKLEDRQGDPAAAQRTLREAAKRGVAGEAMQRELASLLSEQGRGAEALALLESIGATADAKTLDARAVAFAEAERFSDARASFEAALAAAPSDPDILLHRGALALRERNPAEARQWFEKALAAKPDAPGTLASLGTAQAEVGDSAGALQSWTRATDIDPEQFDALFNLGVLEGRLGKLVEAHRHLVRFAAKAPRKRFAAQLAESRKLLAAMGNQ